MARESAAVLTLTCLLAFVLLIVTCCSAPASRAISLFTVSLQSATQRSHLDVGILGICLSTSQGPSGLCSKSTLGFQVIMSRPRSGDPVGVSAGWDGRVTSGGIASGQNVQVLASEDLTRAMIFSPLGAAVAGAATIIALAAWASRGNRGLGLGAIILSAITAVFSWIAFAVNMAISVKVQQGVHDLQRFLPSGQDLSFTFGAATFLPLGAAVAISAALAWTIYEYQREHSEPSRRGSESADPLSSDHSHRRTEKERR